MKQIKNYSISTGITLGTILILSFIINIFNYYDLIPKSIYKTILILVTALSILIGSYLLGKKTEKKGYIEGLKYSVLIIALFYIIAFLAFDKTITISSLLYYLIIVITSCIGAMIGINKNDKKLKN